MKYILNLTCALALMASFPLMAREGHEGGGGAGLCTNNKCITLIEAGFRVANPAAPSFEPSGHVIAELDEIDRILPISDFNTTKIIGNSGDIVFIDIANIGKAQKFLKDYHAMLVAQGSSAQASKIELLGFTIGDITYLIQQKYEALSTRSQALLLIHEYSLRVHKVTLEKALKFDGAMLDYINAVERRETPNVLALLDSCRGFGFFTEDYLKHVMLAQVLVAADFKGSFFEDAAPFIKQDWSNNIVLDYKTILDWRSFNPNVTKYLASGEYSVYRSERGEALSRFKTYLNGKISESSSGQYVVTQSTFREFLGEWKYPQNFIEALSGCGDKNDKRVKPVRPSMFPLYGATFLWCEVKTLPTFLGSNPLKFLSGVDLDFAGQMVCQKNHSEIKCRAN